MILTREGSKMNNLMNKLQRVSISAFRSNSGPQLLVKNNFITSSQTFSQAKNEPQQDEHEFQRDISSGIKNLEKLGIAKGYWSWPQYNRIIYPPAEDGKLLKNPFVHHMRTFIKYDQQKLWYPAFMVNYFQYQTILFN